MATNLASVDSCVVLQRSSGSVVVATTLGIGATGWRYWLSPLPVEATIVEFEWPALDIGATRTMLDGGALAGALQ